MTGNVRADMLYGFHKYVDNGAIVENSTQYANTTYTNKKSTVLGNTPDKSSEILFLRKSLS